MQLLKLLRHDDNHRDDRDDYTQWNVHCKYSIIVRRAGDGGREVHCCEISQPVPACPSGKRRPDRREER